jgi:peptidoglycan-associated lipoprotein
MEERKMFKRMKPAASWPHVFAVVAVVAVAAGCHTKTPVPIQSNGGTVTTSSNTGNGKPVIEFTVEPSTIDRGNSATLKWSVSGANYISIDVFGAVQATGSRNVSPYDTITYHLKAEGTAGTSTAESTLTVNPGNPPVPPPVSGDGGNASHLSLNDRVAQQIQDVFFAYDQNDISGEAQGTLTRDATAIKSILQDFPTASLIVEGHCDERGSAEYNLGLGDRRATSAKEFLVQLGVPAGKLRTVSYGKERPQCTEATEDCYARNRRAHITAAP